MASVSGSSTQSADSSASQKSDVWNFGKKNAMSVMFKGAHIS